MSYKFKFDPGIAVSPEIEDARAKLEAAYTAAANAIATEDDLIIFNIAISGLCAFLAITPLDQQTCEGFVRLFAQRLSYEAQLQRTAEKEKAN